MPNRGRSQHALNEDMKQIRQDATALRSGAADLLAEITRFTAARKAGRDAAKR